MEFSGLQDVIDPNAASEPLTLAAILSRSTNPFDSLGPEDYPRSHYASNSSNFQQDPETPRQSHLPLSNPHESNFSRDVINFQRPLASPFEFHRPPTDPPDIKISIESPVDMNMSEESPANEEASPESPVDVKMSPERLCGFQSRPESSYHSYLPPESPPDAQLPPLDPPDSNLPPLNPTDLHQSFTFGEPPTARPAVIQYHSETLLNLHQPCTFGEPAITRPTAIQHHFEIPLNVRQSFTFGEPAITRPAAIQYHSEVLLNLRQSFTFGEPAITRPTAVQLQPFTFGEPAITGPTAVQQQSFTFGEPAMTRPTAVQPHSENPQNLHQSSLDYRLTECPYLGPLETYCEGCMREAPPSPKRPCLTNLSRTDTSTRQALQAPYPAPGPRSARLRGLVSSSSPTSLPLVPKSPSPARRSSHTGQPILAEQTSPAKQPYPHVRSCPGSTRSRKRANLVSLARPRGVPSISYPWIDDAAATSSTKFRPVERTCPKTWGHFMPHDMQRLNSNIRGITHRMPLEIKELIRSESSDGFAPSTLINGMGRDDLVYEFKTLQAVRDADAALRSDRVHEATWASSVYEPLLRHAVHNYPGLQYYKMTNAHLMKDLYGSNIEDTILQKHLVDYVVTLGPTILPDKTIDTLLKVSPGPFCHTLNPTAHPPICRQLIAINVNISVQSCDDTREGYKGHPLLWAVACMDRMRLLARRRVAISLPVLRIDESAWCLDFVCDLGDKIKVLRTPIGNTKTLKGCYTILHGLRILLDWAKGPFLRWFEENIVSDPMADSDSDSD